MMCQIYIDGENKCFKKTNKTCIGCGKNICMTHSNQCNVCKGFICKICDHTQLSDRCLLIKITINMNNMQQQIDEMHGQMKSLDDKMEAILCSPLGPVYTEAQTDFEIRGEKK